MKWTQIYLLFDSLSYITHNYWVNYLWLNLYKLSYYCSFFDYLFTNLYWGYLCSAINLLIINFIFLCSLFNLNLSSFENYLMTLYKFIRWYLGLDSCETYIISDCYYLYWLDFMHISKIVFFYRLNFIIPISHSLMVKYLSLLF
jgi:hypothetical protein